MKTRTTWMLFVLFVGTSPSVRAEESIAPGIEVARVGKVGPVPPAEHRIVVSVDAGGVLRVGSRETDLASLRSILTTAIQRPEWREDDGMSRADLVLAVDVGIPWRVVQWILHTAAYPPLKVWRVHHLARSSEDGTEGAVTVFLPKDGSDVVEQAASMVLIGFEAAGGMDPAGLGAAMTSGKRAPLPVELDAEGLVTTGFVVQALDAILRAGTSDIRLRGAPAPAGEDAIARLIAESLSALRRPTITLGDRRTLIPIPQSSHVADFLAGRTRKGPRPRAVESALEWLAAHQSTDGRWECSGFGRWCDGKEVEDGPVPDGAGKPMYDVGVTGLACLAYLGAGYTNRGDTPYAKTVAKGLRYLKGTQDPEGCFGPRTTQHFIYPHAIATLAMVEAYGMTESPIFLGAARKAIDFCLLCRNPYFAWRYGVKPGDNDTSVTGWMASALEVAGRINEASAKRGRPVPFPEVKEALQGAGAWVRKMTDSTTGRVGYIQPGSGPARPTELVDKFPTDRSEAMTAAGLWVRLVGGEDPKTDASLQGGVSLLRALLPSWNTEDGSIDMYYWYYGDLAMNEVAGEAWEAWHGALEKAALDNQRTDGTPCTFRGSWDPVDPWGPDGGRVYSTAIMTLILETPHRYARVTPPR